MKLNLGKFQDEEGNVVDTEPEPDQPFPIRCGPWPNPHEQALQRICSLCGDSIGLSPKGLAYHEALPMLRPLCCGFCFDMLMSMLNPVEGQQE